MDMIEAMEWNFDVSGFSYHYLWYIDFIDFLFDKMPCNMVVYIFECNLVHPFVRSAWLQHVWMDIQL